MISEYQDEQNEVEEFDRDYISAEEAAIRADWESSQSPVDYRFIIISNGVCPECNGDLDEAGYCGDCHIIPALNPDYQEWLANA